MTSRLRGVRAARSCPGFILNPLACVVGTSTYEAPVICTKSL